MNLGEFGLKQRQRRVEIDALGGIVLAHPVIDRIGIGLEGGNLGLVRVVAEGAKPVRRGSEWLLKTGAGTLPLSPAEAEAAGWVLSRREVDEAGLSRAHPGVDAAGFLQRLAGAGLLAQAAS